MRIQRRLALSDYIDVGKSAGNVVKYAAPLVGTVIGRTTGAAIGTVVGTAVSAATTPGDAEKKLGAAKRAGAYGALVTGISAIEQYAVEPAVKNIADKATVKGEATLSRTATGIAAALIVAVLLLR